MKLVELKWTAWHREVAAAITQLTQEVHGLNPGLRCDFNLDIIREPLREEVERENAQALREAEASGHEAHAWPDPDGDGK